MTKKKNNHNEEKKKKEEPRRSPLWYLTVAIIAAVVGLLNWSHIWTLFENDKHFSHLADFEREMAYRTEMGLYYSYYKTVITAPTFSEGLRQITRDNVTEYGHEINTLHRFNLYPELIIGFFYRQFKAYADLTKWRVEWCWQVNRGNLPPVQSCEGIGNPHYFYINVVFVVAGVVASVLFVSGVVVSNSILGGLLTVASFAFNHGEATRVQWTPPLRESFGFPFIFAHIMLLTYVVKHGKSGLLYGSLLALLAVPALLFWQFSQFAFFTQISSLLTVFSLELLPIETAKTIGKSHLMSFGVSFVLLFGNEMALTALYFPSIIAFLVIIKANQVFDKIRFRPVFVLFVCGSYLFLTLAIKIGLSKLLGVEDDAHIFDILRSKFSSFSNFHTRLYTCSAEFDFLGVATIVSLSKTLLIPLSIASLILFLVGFLASERDTILWRRYGVKEGGGEVAYTIVQAILFTSMGFLIMRLKLFMTPQLCILTSLLASSKFIDVALPRKVTRNVHLAVIFIILAGMSIFGVQNIQSQRQIIGEYSNPDQEMLFDWIEANTKKDAVFAGTMPVMANLKLTTLRPIVNHPHYEHVGIRERTLKVYSIFSKKPIDEVHRTMRDLKVDYVIIQVMNCAMDHKDPKCVYRGMWDEEDPQNRDRSSLCDLLVSAARSRDNSLIAPFKVVYNPNMNYLIIRV